MCLFIYFWVLGNGTVFQSILEIQVKLSVWCTCVKSFTITIKWKNLVIPSNSPRKYYGVSVLLNCLPSCF